MTPTDPMQRDWTDSRDSSRWEIRGTPIAPAVPLGDAVPTQGEGLALDFHSVDQPGVWYHTRAPELASLADVADEMIARLLDEARGSTV